MELHCVAWNFHGSFRPCFVYPKEMFGVRKDHEKPLTQIERPPDRECVKLATQALSSGDRFALLCGSRPRIRMDIAKWEAAAFVEGGIDEVGRLVRRKGSIASQRVPGLVDAIALAANLGFLQQVVLARVVCEGIAVPPRFLDVSALEFIATQPASSLPRCA